MAQHDPEELVRWCRRTLPEDTRAFEALILQYQGQVFGTAMRLMGNRHDAEDMTQEVFLKVYAGIEGLVNPRLLSVWINRITINVCLNELKRQKRLQSDVVLGPLPEGSELAAFADTHLPMPEAAALSAELRRCIEEVLADLGATERTILVLRDVEGCSYGEIAKQFNLGLSAVKMRIHRTRMAFRTIFERVCPGVYGAGEAARS